MIRLGVILFQVHILDAPLVEFVTSVDTLEDAVERVAKRIGRARRVLERHDPTEVRLTPSTIMQLTDLLLFECSLTGASVATMT